MGGLVLMKVSSRGFDSLLVPGLHVAREVLEVFTGTAGWAEFHFWIVRFSGRVAGASICRSLGTESGTDYLQVCFISESGTGYWKVAIRGACRSAGYSAPKVVRTTERLSALKCCTDHRKVSTSWGSSWSDCFAHRQVALGLSLMSMMRVILASMRESVVVLGALHTGAGPWELGPPGHGSRN